MSEQQAVAAPPPAVLIVVGASGAGKTTLVSRLAALGLPGVGCYHFDNVAIAPAEEIAARFSDGEAFQAWGLGEWLVRLMRNEDQVRVAVLDTQARPAALRDAFARHGVARAAAVLVDCHHTERNGRLRGQRGQPELANPQMDSWAAYLRTQADALGVPVIDTTGRHPDDCLGELRRHVAALLDGEQRTERVPRGAG